MIGNRVPPSLVMAQSLWRLTLPPNLGPLPFELFQFLKQLNLDSILGPHKYFLSDNLLRMSSKISWIRYLFEVFNGSGSLQAGSNTPVLATK